MQADKQRDNFMPAQASIEQRLAAVEASENAMIYQDLHGLAKGAVERMRCMAEKADGDLTEFHERQLVHALFTELTTNEPDLWVAFEYRYYNDSGWLLESAERADIHAERKPSRAWIEVKSTGLNPNGWDNSHLGIWKDDVTKLLRVRDEVNTQLGWVWLFLFETYRQQVKTLGHGSEWTASKSASKEQARNNFPTFWVTSIISPKVTRSGGRLVWMLMHRTSSE